jgi:D-glycero-alpha-D-manno-heptose 1-phosphate guanylyltransferase
MVTEAIILAGGLGTRLRSVVSDVPKPMASIAGNPFLGYLLQFLEAGGVRRVVLAVGYRNEVIRDFFGSRYGAIEIAYSVEEEPLGTGGALQRSLSYLNGPFGFVVNGDTFLRLDYRAMASMIESEEDTQLVVALRRMADASRYGGVLVAGGRIQSFSERATTGSALVNAGCYLLTRDIFHRYPMPAKFSWERDFLQARVADIQPIAYECDVPFIDIGIPESLADAQTLIPSWILPAGRD